LQQAAPTDDTHTALQHIKSKLVRLHSTRLQQIITDNKAADWIEGEQPTL